VTDRDVGALERALVDLGRHLAYPEAGDLAPTVAERIRGVRPLAPPRAAPRTRRAVVLVAAVTALLVGGALVASPALRAALLRFFGLPGVRIEVGESPPPVGRGLDLGERVSLSEARERATFSLATPAALGEPDEVYLDTPPADGLVSMAWRAGPRLPRATETGVGTLLTQFPARTNRELIVKKLAAGGTPVVEVLVDGDPGYWVPGPHTVFLVTEGGSFIEDRARTAGNTLLWSRDGITYRLETGLGMERALAVARTVA
jgi:hypothetical protein